MFKHENYRNLYIVDHPLVLHKLSLMRDEACPKVLFRTLLREIAMLMGYEVTAHLPIEMKPVTTPLETMDAPFVKGKKPVIVPILRAGLGLSDGLEIVMPNARVGHIGLYRDEETKKPVEYLVKLPDLASRSVILVDPMLATGHSAEYALDLLVKHGAERNKIHFMVLVAAPEGVKVIEEAYPDIPVYTATLDRELNEKAYILPGLGDAGDRIFGTKG